MPLHKVVVYVNITPDPTQNPPYNWTYKSNYEGLDSKTGRISLKNPGETEIMYILCETDYQLIFVNMDPKICAARQMHTILLDTAVNSITITDTNDWGLIGTNPISLRLVARVKNQIDCPIISPDPEVQNDPNDR